MALSGAGRAAFPKFPELLADDLYLNSIFDPGQRREVAAAAAVIATPLRSIDLLRRLTRVRAANAALRSHTPWATPARRLAWLRDVVAPEPRLWPAAPVYLGFTLAAALAGRRPGAARRWAPRRFQPHPGAGPVTPDRTAAAETNPLVSVVVVSYRTRELTVRALRLLHETPATVPYEVIVVDNASGDGSAPAVRAAFPRARVIELARNVGFGAAVNVAAGTAQGQWLLLLNPDTEPVGDPVSALVDHARVHPRHRIYAGRTLRPDGRDDGRSVFALPSLHAGVCFATGLSTLARRWSWSNPEELPGLDRRVPAVVPAASGCLLLIERTLFDALGGFTPDYFMYSEDADFCARAADAGATPVLVPEARVRHHGGAASTGAGKLLMLLRGKVTYLRLRWPARRARIGRALLLTGVALRAALPDRPGRAPWRTAWQRRQEWLAGWPPASPGTADQPQARPAAISGSRPV